MSASPTATPTALVQSKPSLHAALTTGAPRTLCFFGGPYVVDGSTRIAVPEGSKRLLVFVALHEGHVDRRFAAGTLWPDGGDDRAAGNLRSALWRLRGAGIDVLHADKCTLWLDPDIDFDLHAIYHWAERILEGEACAEDLRMPRRGADATELLPGWYDDWVIFERERLRQRLLHALEALSRLLVEARRFAQAIEAALEAVHVDPLRESAHRTLIKAHLAEGNLVEARRIVWSYWESSCRELGVEPSPALGALVGLHLPRVRRDTASMSGTDRL